MGEKQQAVRHATKEEAVQYGLEDAAIAYVRLEQGVVCGTLACTFQPDPILYGFSHTGKDKQGAAELYLAIRKQLRAMGYETVVIPVHAQNLGLYRKLLKCGFYADQVIVSMRGKI